jgi:hypothetical protein
MPVRATYAMFGKADAALKAGARPHQVLMDVAHDCLARASDGATCKADADKPNRHTGELMAHLDGAHGSLGKVNGASCSMAMCDHGGDMHKADEPLE